MIKSLIFAAAVTATSTAAAVSDPCDRHADIVAVRHADDAARATLRKKLDDEVAGAKGRAKGCAAAVAAEAALAAGDKARAAEFLDVVAAELPALASSMAPHRALLAAELGQIDVATKHLESVSPKAVEWRARIELALARAQQDKATTTLLLTRMTSKDPKAVEALCTQGNANRCIDLLVRYPGHPLARAREDGVDLSQTASVTVEWFDLRGKNLLAVARPQRAVTEAQRWLGNHAAQEPGRGRIVANLTQGLLRLGKNAEAVDASRLDLSRAAFDDAMAEQARAHAKALGRQGKYADAATVWRQLAGVAQVAGRADVVAEAAFLGAFCYVEGDQIDDALAAFELAAPEVKGTTWETQLLWQQALLTLTAKNQPTTALAYFDAVVALNDKEVRKHRYWRARALDFVDPKKAKQERELLIGEDPLDWYGQLARRDLGKKPISGGKAIARDALQRSNGHWKVDDEDARDIRLLWSLGFEDVAVDRCRARALVDKRASLDNIGLCQSIDDANFGWRRGGLYLPSPMTQKNRLNPSPSWRVSYAAPWPAVVDAAAKTASVPPSFVYAIMRTESGFDDDAVSVAGAKGALQLLPSVARAVGKRVPHSGHDDVDDHVQLGAGMLGLLLKEHGSLLLAAAAYNGAPEHAQSWVQRFGALPVDVFVERIPFRETRDYVKRVLAVEAVYRGLDGGDVVVDLPASLTPTTTFTTFPYDE